MMIVVPSYWVFSFSQPQHSKLQESEGNRVPLFSLVYLPGAKVRDIQQLGDSNLVLSDQKFGFRSQVKIRGQSPAVNTMGEWLLLELWYCSQWAFENPTKPSLEYCLDLNFVPGNRKSQNKKTLTMIFSQVWQRVGKWGMVGVGEREGPENNKSI